MADKKTQTFDEANFETQVLQSDQVVLVDFWAEWCAPARALTPVIDTLATEFDGVAKIGKVDVDSNTTLATTYQVQSIPTLLFFKGGKVVDRQQGLAPREKIADRLAALTNDN